MDAKLLQNDETSSDSKKPKHINANDNDDVINDPDDKELDLQVDKNDWFEKLAYMDW